ncbi:hypothetical protein AUJ13_03460 [Candidatus Micrarchaeota archaeon CG1_02_49_24]|nr:MAG: hypothetical protein AUJ13_03460 [Candidatus Micrarchaeota archaeon CG1_02_49_24]
MATKTTKLSERISKLPPYLFAGIEKTVEEKRKQGVEIISFGIGDPDLPAPAEIRERLAVEARDQENHNYSSSKGELEFREAVVGFMDRRFGVSINSSQVCACLGSKEAIANIARAFVNPGDNVICPNPGYPVYAQGATILCDGIPRFIPLLEKNNFLPDLDELENLIDARTRIVYLNYPNNPTSAIASRKFMERLADIFERKNAILAYDNAYSEFTYGDYVAPSILEFTGNAIEFHSLSKTFCMTGDRIGFAVGRKEYVGGLVKVKSQIDSGNPVYTQKAGAFALGLYKGREKPECVKQILREYELRRKVLAAGLKKIGLKVFGSNATFYVWARVPEGSGGDIKFAERCLERGVVATPGSGFGSAGKGYVRFALTQPMKRIIKALGHIERVL